ncbi:MAG: PilN domain-containing protein [Kofleriaceae bacterium]
MIKVNLLPQRKVKRVSEPGQAQVAAGIGAILLAAAAVFFLVHKPMSDARAELEEQTQQLADSNGAKAAKLSDLDALRKEVAAQKTRGESIKQLQGMRAIPANMLHELSEILTLGHSPTMTTAMAQRVSSGPGGDPNRRFSLDWDPKKVWITSFKETKGEFVLDGGAQTDADVTQLAKRMQASVYFEDVTPRGGERVTEGSTGVSYFKFTITGKVVY